MARDPSPTETDEEEPSALEEAFERYAENGLRLPPIPRELVDELDEFADWQWGSEPLSLEDRDGFLQAARTPGGDPAIAFGHIGHGASSWWLCYRLQLETLAIYVRLAYGGVYENNEAATARANDTAAQLEELIPAAAAAQAAGRFAGGHRLIVVLDEKQRGFWEVAGGPNGPQRSRRALEDALKFCAEPVLNAEPAAEPP